jgi:membrane protein CcdC involved in cytochrome C biogenesis
MGLKTGMRRAMAEAEDRVSTREIVVTILLKVSPAALVLIWGVLATDRILAVRQIVVPGSLRAAVIFLALLLIYRFTAADLLRRLRLEPPRKK